MSELWWIYVEAVVVLCQSCGGSMLQLAVMILCRSNGSFIGQVLWLCVFWAYVMGAVSLLYFGGLSGSVCGSVVGCTSGCNKFQVRIRLSSPQQSLSVPGCIATWDVRYSMMVFNPTLPGVLCKQ